MYKRQEDIRKLLPNADVIETSLIEGGGIEDIEDTIENLVYGGKISQSESTMVNNVRHIELLERGRDSLKDALDVYKRQIIIIL